jgi:hypothetical protein
VDAVANTLVLLPTLPTTYTAQVYKPCISSTASICPAISNNPAGLNSPRWVQADSTGSIWIANYGYGSLMPANGGLVQVIGLAAPTWPLAEQKPGVMP